MAHPHTPLRQLIVRRLAVGAGLLAAWTMVVIPQLNLPYTAATAASASSASAAPAPWVVTYPSSKKSSLSSSSSRVPYTPWVVRYSSKSSSSSASSVTRDDRIRARLQRAMELGQQQQSASMAAAKSSLSSSSTAPWLIAPGSSSSSSLPASSSRASAASSASSRSSLSSVSSSRSSSSAAVSSARSSQSSSFTLQQARDAIIRLTNEERARQNLELLVWDDALMDFAQAYAVDMNTRKFFSHVNPEGKDFQTRLNEINYGSTLPACDGCIRTLAAGENIATGQRSPEEVMRDWIASPRHYENILSERYNRIGVGWNGLYWVTEFGGVHEK